MVRLLKKALAMILGKYIRVMAKYNMSIVDRGNTLQFGKAFPPASHVSDEPTRRLLLIIVFFKKHGI